MLKLIIQENEVFNAETNEFISIKGQTIVLEHSLVSLAKWESKWGKPFLSKEEKTMEETIDYIKCMTITQNVNDNLYLAITEKELDKINKYIEAPMTATWFSQDDSKRPGREIITAEIIYYWMIQFQIPFECQKWHLNRLFTLIRVCSIKSSPDKKMSRKDALMRQKELNDARRKARNSKG